MAGMIPGIVGITRGITILGGAILPGGDRVGASAGAGVASMAAGQDRGTAVIGDRDIMAAIGVAAIGAIAIGHMQLLTDIVMPAGVQQVPEVGAHIVLPALAVRLGILHHREVVIVLPHLLYVLRPLIIA